MCPKKNDPASVTKKLQQADAAVREKRRVGKYDVFFSYSREDEAVVIRVAEVLKRLGICPWVDVWDNVPGQPWQEHLEDAIARANSAAVFLGPSGTGPWQDQEVRAVIQQFVKRKAAVMPVILPGVKKTPELPVFLSAFQWVDLRAFRDDNIDPIKNLVAGILRRPMGDLLGKNLEPSLLDALEREQSLLMAGEGDTVTMTFELDMDRSEISDQDLRFLAHQIADRMGIPSSAVRLVRIEKGSIVVHIEFKSRRDAARLVSMIQEKDPGLCEILRRYSVDAEAFLLKNSDMAEPSRPDRDSSLEPQSIEDREPSGEPARVESYDRSKKLAVVVGVKEYSDSTFTDLDYAERDAAAVYETLLKGSYHISDTRLMTRSSTSPELWPTRNNFLREIRRMCAAAGRDDTVLLYFSGHGIEHKGENYLVPSDALGEIVVDTAVPLSTIMEMLRESPSESKIIVLDSCHSGARKGQKDIGRMTEGFLNALRINMEGWAILSSCKEREVSWEWKEVEQSAFTHFLVKALKGEAGCDAEGRIFISDVAKYVSEKVSAWARNSGKQQTPTLMVAGAEPARIEIARVEPKPPTPTTAREKSLVEQITEGRALNRLERFKLKPSSIRSYKEILEHEPDLDNRLHIELVPFRSRVNVREYHGHAENMDYHLRFYLPAASTQQKRWDRLVVMFNGLAEATPAIYDDLALEFAKHDIPCVLFPLTNHYFRRKTFNCDPNDIFTALNKKEAILNTQKMVMEIAAQPERLIDGFVQMMSDLDGFAGALGDRNVNPFLHNYCKKHFTSKLNVCLLGYSLGGIFVLSHLLRHPDRFHSVYLLESGANFADINGGVLFVRNESLAKLVWKDLVVEPVRAGKKKIEEVKRYLVSEFDNEKMEEAWEKVVERVQSGECIADLGNKEPAFFQSFVRDQDEASAIWDQLVLKLDTAFKGFDMDPEEAAIFEKIVLGNFKTSYKEKLTELWDKILIFLGGTDVVFTAAAIQSFAPQKTGLAIMEIPKLGHWLKFSSVEEWEIWREFIVKTIINFGEVGPVARVHKPKEIANV